MNSGDTERTRLNRRDSDRTVAIMPEVDEVSDVDINPADLRIDTYRASGAGGQHINKTDSAVRITHLPTGIVVECQDDRSQHKNKAQALKVLAARIRDARTMDEQWPQVHALPRRWYCDDRPPGTRDPCAPAQ